MILLTAFEPFGGESVNPAELAVRSLEGSSIRTLILPVEYGRAARMAADEIRRLQPHAVICTGQAGGRKGITPEKYAFNLRSSSSPDNAGKICLEEPVLPGGPEKLESRFGAEAIAKAIQRKGIPAYVSESAGRFVCNDVMYSVLYELKDTSVPAGFIHVPFCTEQAARHPDAFAMSVGDISKGLLAAVEHIKTAFGLDL